MPKMMIDHSFEQKFCKSPRLRLMKNGKLSFKEKFLKQSFCEIRLKGEEN